MSSTTFILASSSSSSSTSQISPIQSSSTLHLLPFSLGSSSKPYKTTTSATSQFFIPRPAPPNTPGIPTGTPIAAFRGRALVGQSVEVPKGYKGIVLSTTARPDHGGLEERRGGNSQVKAPLTPAPSVGSVSTSISEEAGSRRSTRTKGAGQVALSRPRTRLAPKKANTKQRIRLDSDEEDEDEDEKGVIQGVEDTSRGALRRTPSKRSRSESGIPAIVIQQPTPRKSRSALTSTSTEISISETLVDVEEGPEGEIDNGSKGDAIGIEPTMEDVVPSPATENDPPVFSITPRQSLTDVTNLTSPDGARDGDEDNPQEEDRAVRVLRPKAMFSEITLWTPDAPLAGFKADELLSRPTVEDEVKSEIVGEKTAVVVQSEVKEEDVKPGVKEEEAGTSLQKGWWRVGGAGEGGDDFVRAMGEWLGMVEMLNEPVYLDNLKDEDDVEDA